MALGGLKVQCFSEQRRYIPIDKCKVKITPTGEDGVAVGDTIELYTDDTGSTDTIELDAPPIENSNQPGTIPYSFAEVIVEREGFFACSSKWSTNLSFKSCSSKCKLT